MTHRLRSIKDKLIKLERSGLRISDAIDYGDPGVVLGYNLETLSGDRWRVHAHAKTFEEALQYAEEIYHSKRAGERETDTPPPNPFPNEWAARQIDPKHFARFRRKSVGDGISLVIGFPSARVRKPGRGESEVQSVRFAKSKWTRRQAAEWLADHDFRTHIE
jgi:hypothetical protein